MSGKYKKKQGNKQKQANVKISRSQEHIFKSKPETESSSKDLTELEKELFTIKIDELEEKVSRKTQLCEFLKEQKTFFEAEHKGLKLLKKESMDLLNKTYREFFFQLKLLTHEVNALEEGYTDTKMKEKTETENTERLRSLSELESSLENKLKEIEQNVEEISLLHLKLHELQDKINLKKKQFEAKVSCLNSEFNEFVKQLEAKLNTIVENTIQDKELKLHLLPVPYQALFLSGQLGSSWCTSVLDSCEDLLRQYAELSKKLRKLEYSNKKIHQELSNALLDLVLSEHIKVLSDYKLDIVQANISENEEFSNDMLQNDLKRVDQLEKLASELEEKIEELTKKLGDLENSISQQEMNGFDNFGCNHMMHIIMQAKDVIVKEL